MNAARKLAADIREMSAKERLPLLLALAVIVTGISLTPAYWPSGVLLILCGFMIGRLTRVAFGYRKAFEGTAEVLREVAPDSPVWDRLDTWKASR